MKILTKRQAKAANFKGRDLRSSTDPELVKERFRDRICTAISYDENRDEVRVKISRGWGGSNDMVLFDREALLVE